MFKNIYLLSDIHGDFSHVRNFYVDNKDILSKDSKENLLILLGDEGINFIADRDIKQKKQLSKYPFTYFCIRGNHDLRPSELMEQHPDKWHPELWFGNKVYVEDAFPQILYALDGGGEYNIQGEAVLVIPGAYSVDKDYRLERHWTWNPTEQLTEDEYNKIMANLKPHYDYIFAHTCPYSWQPQIKDLFLSFLDQSKIDKTMEKYLDTIVEKTDYKHFYFGHYHADRDVNPKATMVYHTALPLGMSYTEYMIACLTK